MMLSDSNSMAAISAVTLVFLPISMISVCRIVAMAVYLT
jgi:hypothetical protein